MYDVCRDSVLEHGKQFLPVLLARLKPIDCWMFLCLVLLQISSCFACKGKQFVEISLCHQTGFVSLIEGQNYTSCVPEGGLEYKEGIKWTVLVFVFAALFILLSKIRKNQLVAKLRYQ